MQLEKFVSLCSSYPFFLVATASVGDSRLLTCPWQLGRNRLGRMGWGLLDFWRTCFETCLQFCQTCFLILRFWRTNRRSQNVRCHQWNCRKTRDNSCVIILKSHLTLQVILPARARFVTFSLIDDSRCARAFSTIAPVRYITQMTTRFYTSRQNKVWEGRIWIINKWRFIERRGKIRVCDSCDDSRKYEAISN